MTYLKTPDDSPIYPEVTAERRFVPNYARIWALVPEAYAGWLTLGGAIRAGMDERRYELVTLVAARRLGSCYCAAAHASVLRDRFFDDETLRLIATDRHHAGLEPADIAAMDFAERIAADPHDVIDADIVALRGRGLSDADILQVVLAVIARRFFAGVAAATGAVTDPEYDVFDDAVVAA
ncbi:MAG TPA: carboxymuconolactone decarboxylase family protein [Asanoa sp.]